MTDRTPPADGAGPTDAAPAARPGDDATRELLGAWALDAVDPGERAAVEDLLTRDPDAAHEAATLRETAALLGAAAARPAPDALRAAVLAAVAHTAQVPADPPAHRDGTVVRPASEGGAGPARPGVAAGPTASTRPGPARPATTGPATARVRRGRLRLAVVAAVVALAVAVPSGLAWHQSRRAGEAEARADRITTLLASPDARVLTGDLTDGGTAVAVVSADAALVTARGVADPGDGRVYQLWVMRDGVPVPDATGDPTADGLELYTTAYRAGDALALTVEPDGGSPAPTTDPLVVLAPA